jgi:hypothetical protein
MLFATMVCGMPSLAAVAGSVSSGPSATFATAWSRMTWMVLGGSGAEREPSATGTRPQLSRSNCMREPVG